MKIPDPQVYEDAIGRLRNGSVKNRTGFATMQDALASLTNQYAPGTTAFIAGLAAERYFEDWRGDQVLLFKAVRGSRAMQEVQALFLTLVAELAERGEMP